MSSKRVWPDRINALKLTPFPCSLQFASLWSAISPEVSGPFEQYMSSVGDRITK